MTILLSLLLLAPPNAVTLVDDVSECERLLVGDSVLPPEFKSAFDAERAPTMAAFFALPETNREFSHVFGRAAKQGELKKVKDVSRRLAADLSGRGKIVGKHAATPKQLVDAVAAGSEKVVVFVGHNEGGELRLPGGERVGLRKLSEACGQAGKLCVFLVCDSAEIAGQHAVGIRGRLTVSDASVVFRDLAVQLAATSVGGKQTSVADVRAVVVASLNKRKCDARVQYLEAKGEQGLVIIGVIVVGYGIACEVLDACPEPQGK